jgi:protein required for attachment to host cells
MHRPPAVWRLAAWRALLRTLLGRRHHPGKSLGVFAMWSSKTAGRFRLPGGARMGWLKQQRETWFARVGPPPGVKHTMLPWYLIVANGSRARFFSIEWSERPEVEGGPKLVEQGDLVHSEAKLKDRDLYTSREGRSSGPASGTMSGYDDHREQNRAEHADRFARRIAETARDYVARRQPPVVLLAAKAQSLGRLREALGDSLSRTAQVTELPEDLSRHDVTGIVKALVRRGIMKPPTVPAASVYRPHGQPREPLV